MVSLPTPIPASVAGTLSGMFSGTLGWILWRLFVLAVGGIVLLVVVASTSSWLVYAILGMVLTIALSRKVRRALYDIWRANFYRVKI